MKKFIISLVVILICKVADAGIIIDIQAASGQQGVYENGKLFVPSFPGQVLTMQVCAIVSGTNSIINDDKIQTISGAIKLDGAGKLSLDSSSNPFGYVAPFDESIHQPDITDTQLGVVAATNGTGSMWWRSGTMNANSVADQRYLLGSFLYTVAAGSASINYLKPASGVGTLTFTIDGVVYMGREESGRPLVNAGAPFVVVPEPSILALLLITSLGGLLLWHRRR